MKVNILGFNLFAKGGTTRSNINLIKALQKSGYNITYFNSQDFEYDDIIRLLIHENINPNIINIEKADSYKKMADCDFLILTRESLFPIARFVKSINPGIKIVGEIHGPLKYIKDDMDLALDSIDAIRVSTEDIKKEFEERFNYNSVFAFYVNASHINIQKQPINTKRNIFIKARFEDNIKDISYVIRLVNYVVNIKQNSNIQLYIVGYGPSEMLYRNLINYYGLADNVHLNEKEPKSYIYISSSPYETLGYSILETLAQGNRVLIYPGDDNVLEDIYKNYNGVRFLSKNIEEDYTALMGMFATENKYTASERLEDVENMEKVFLGEDYGEKYFQLMNQAISVNSLLPVKSAPSIEIFSNKRINKLNKRKDIYKKILSFPGVKQVMKNKYFSKITKHIYDKEKELIFIRSLEKITPDKNKVFIESFHGKNFSGDPKYIALQIKEMFQDKQIYVSSVNSLVDIEIRDFGFIPVRFGTEHYIKTFRQCKYVFMNGNSWDKVYKHKEQIFVQTWHGFPLKKMVNDLSNKEEKSKQLEQFLPRMKKWDFLLTSSNINRMLLKSAFKLETHKNLKILDYGAPRNEYLIKNNKQEEKLNIQLKYMQHREENVKYILYCPTWRKGKRNNVTNLNLKKLLEFLPEEYEIIVKLHPNESHLRKKYSSLDTRIHCFYNEFVDIQELYLISDIMITDYSSTIFDYAHLNKPILLLQEDEKEYLNDIGFYFDVNELGKFPIANKDEQKLAHQILYTSDINYSNVIESLMKEDSINSSFNILQTIFEEKDVKRKYNL